MKLTCMDTYMSSNRRPSRVAVLRLFYDSLRILCGYSDLDCGKHTFAVHLCRGVSNKHPFKQP